MKKIYQINTDGDKWNNVAYIKPSKYHVPGIKNAINHLIKNYSNNHIVCIKYKQGDTQLGLTETGKRWENNLDETMIRGVGEELNISIGGISDKYEMSVKQRKRNIKLYFFKI
jgi:hypothetical protein